MSSFFKISIELVENKSVAIITWPDYKHKNRISKSVENAVAFRAFVLAELPHILKSILKRYAKHQITDLKGCDAEKKASDFNTYCKELNRRKSLGDVCSFINLHKHRIEAIKPLENHKWCSVIDELISYAHSYKPLSTDTELQQIINSHFNKTSHATIS